MMQLKGTSSDLGNSQTCEGIGNSHSIGGSEQSFPFANDNVGTIRMRSNSHVQEMLDEPLADNAEHHKSQYQNGNSEDIEHASQQQHQQK